MIIFLYGDDAFRSREKLTQLKQAYLDKNPSSGLFECDFSESPEDTVKEWMRALSETGLFATKKLVIAQYALQSPSDVQEKVLGFMAAREEWLLSSADTVLILWEGSTPKKTNTLFKWLDAHVVKKQSFERLTGERLRQWIIHRVHVIDTKTEVEPAALTLLMTEAADDLSSLENTLRVLVDSCEGGVIRVADVRAVVATSIKSTVFEALEALAAGHRERALGLFEAQLAKGENALQLLAMCAWQLRNLLKVVDGYESGLRSAPLLAKELKLHPFMVQKLLQKRQGFSLERIKQGFALLAELDTQSKSGRIDPKVALDLFVMKV